MKQFSCVLSDPCFKKSINVDTNECRTVQDLMPRISSLLQIDENQFTVSNANPDNVLSLLDNNFEFQLEFNNHCPDFTINFPDEFVQKVTNGSNMNFHDIIRCIQNERSIYYSPSCINNINIMVWGIPLPKTGNHLSRMPNNVKISFQLDVNTVSIIFDQKAFIFPENEPFERGKNFIENVLGQNVEVSIQNITNNQSLHNGDLLQTNKLYEINARENFTFNSIDEYYYFDQKMDYFSTVFDAKQMLAHINYNACQNILPENILIFCRGSDEIIDPYYRLDNIQKLGGIYFRISLKIYFKFDVTNAVRYDDFISELKPNTQICDIAANFSKFFGINQKLLFLNNRKEEVPYTKSLNEIDHMKTIENGKKKNILYIKIINNGPNTNVHNPGTTEACTTGTTATSTACATEATCTTRTTVTEATSTTETTETTSTTGAAEPRVIHESQCDESADANSTHRGYLGEYLLEKLMPQLKRRNLLGSGASSKVYRVRFIDEFNNYDENARDTYYSLKVYNREYFLKSKESPATCSINDNDNDTEEEEELIEIDFEKVQKFILEYEIILSLSHPNIIKAFGINPGSEKYSPCILFEYVPYSLDKLIPIKENSPIKLQKIHLVGIIYEICKAMDCIHKKNIIHRDIKPSNILITSECHPKICDFGISTFCSSDSVSQTSGIGTIKFMAPEILNQDKHYTENVDVYSFGVLVHYILSNGEFPKIIGNEVTVSKNINDVSKELITRCLSFNPEQRPSFAEIIELINESQLLLIDGIEDDILLLYEFLGFF